MFAAGRFAEAVRLGKLAETLSRLAHGPHTLSGAGGARRGGASHADRGHGSGSGFDANADEEPEFPQRDEPFMTPGETRRSPYQMQMLRLEVGERLERLAASFEPRPTASGPDLHAPDHDDPNFNDLTEGETP